MKRYFRCGILVMVIFSSFYFLTIPQFPDKVCRRILTGRTFLSYSKIPMDKTEVREGMFLASKEGDKYFKLVKDGEEVGYVRENSELGYMEIAPIESLSTDEAREKFYETVLGFTYQDVVSKNAKRDIIIKDADLMEKFFRELPSNDFELGDIKGNIEWHYDDYRVTFIDKNAPEEAKKGALKFKRNPINGTGGLSAQILPNKMVFIMGTGTIGTKAAKALFESGYDIAWTKRSVDQDALEMGKLYGFKFYPLNEETRGKFAEAGIKVEDETVEQLFARMHAEGETPYVVDATSGKGKPTAFERYKEELYIPYGVRVLGMGAEKNSQFELIFAATGGNYQELRNKQFVKLVSCNTHGTLRILVPELKAAPHPFSADIVYVRRGADPGNSKSGPIDSAEAQFASHHYEDVVAVLESRPDLMENLEAINSDAEKVPTQHFHLNIATLRDTGLTVEQVRELLKAQPRVAILDVKKLNTAQLLEAISKKIKTVDASDPYIIFAMVGESRIPGDIKIAFAVPQESDVIPSLVNAVDGMLGILPEAGSINIVDETLGIDVIKQEAELLFGKP